ncbi:MAG: RNA polymerase sigma factor [Acidimicrobiales bacterium]
MGATKAMAYRLPLPEEEDRVLAARVSRKPTAASFDLLYRNFSAPLLAFCRSRLGDPVEAEDACHETLLLAHKHLADFRPGARIWPWLSTIAANVCRDMQRRRSHISDEPVPSNAPAAALEEQLERRMTVQLVHEAMAQLPRQHRSLLYRREFEDWSYTELAEFEGTSLGAIRSALFRARRLLRTEIEAASSRSSWPLPTIGPIARLRAVWHGWSTSLQGVQIRVAGRVNSWGRRGLDGVTGAAVATALGVGALSLFGGVNTPDQMAPVSPRPMATGVLVRQSLTSPSGPALGGSAASAGGRTGQELPRRATQAAPPKPTKVIVETQIRHVKNPRDGMTIADVPPVGIDCWPNMTDVYGLVCSVLEHP